MIEVTYFYGVHQGGTKDYHLYLFQSSGHALIIRRYGKLGTDGQIMQEGVEPKKASAAFNKLLKERSSKGYDMRPQTVTNPKVHTAAEAIALLPRKQQSSITNYHIARLEGRDPTGERGSYDPLAAERDASIGRELRERAAAEAKAQQLAELNALQSNPNFGIF